MSSIEASSSRTEKFLKVYEQNPNIKQLQLHLRMLQVLWSEFKEVQECTEI
jgi:hypothetical protein